MAVAALLLAPAFLLSGFRLFQLTMMAVYAVAILGLGLVTGYTGQVSLGHGAFYAVGAYASAILMTNFAWPYWATLPVAGAVCAAFGFAVGFPALRLTGHYLALVTFALAVAVPQILRAHFAEGWTGGVQGLVIVGPEAPAGLPLSPDQWMYLFTVAVAAGLFALARNLLAGRMRHAMVAIRDHAAGGGGGGHRPCARQDPRLRAQRRLTGIAGGLGAIAVQFVAPDSFSVQLSIALFVGLVVGGAGSLPGAVLGAAFVQFVPNLPELVNKSAPGVVYGVLLVATLFLMPHGVAGHAARRIHKPAREEQPMISTKDAAGHSGAGHSGAGHGGAGDPRAAGARAGGGHARGDGQVDQDRQHQSAQRPRLRLQRDRQCRDGVFKMVNDQGGIGGRKIEFISLDDAYLPPKTVEQTRRLVEQDGVAFILNGLGTACQTAVRQVHERASKVPQLFVATGADKWGDPAHFPWTMGWQPSYRTEAAIYGKYILREKPAAKVGVLYQNDDFGKDYLIGLKDGLGDAYAKLVVKEVSYETTDPTIESQAVSLQSAGVDVLLTAATPKWAAQMIRKVADLNWKPLHFMTNVSISVGAVISPAGVEKAVGVISAAYGKDTTDPQWANDEGMQQWRAFMARIHARRRPHRRQPRLRAMASRPR